MIKRGSQRNLTTGSDSSNNQNTKTRNVGTITDENSTQSFQETMEVVPSPVFHIHIHVPSDSKPNTSKMYLPRIQPVIHLHYDELVKKLRNDKMQSRGLHQRYLKKIVSQSTPKFGSVLFHYKNNSFRGNFTENKIITSTPHRELRSRKKLNNDLETIGNNVPEITPSEMPQIESGSESGLKLADELFNDSSKGGAQGNNSAPVAQNVYPIKLKEAVVVLKDICKTKSYKDISTDQIQNEKTAEKSPTSNQVKISVSQIKTERESFVSRAYCTNSIEKPSETEGESFFSRAYCTNSIEKPSETEGGESPSVPRHPEWENSEEEKARKRESLASLVEGCNFSEILKRFKGKNSQLITDSLRNSKFLAKKKNEMKTVEKAVEDGMDGDLSPSPKPFAPKKEFITDLYEEQGSPKIPSNGIHSEETETELSRNYQAQTTSPCGVEENGSHDSHGHGIQESSKADSAIAGENEIDHSKNNFHADDDNDDATSDNSVNTTSSNLSSETVEFNSNYKCSGIAVKVESDSPEKNEISSVHKGDEGFEYLIKEKDSDINMDEKEKNGKRKQQFKVLNMSPNRSKDGSPAKKMRPSSESPEKLAKEKKNKSPMRDDSYIPLNASGPTKFAVAPLQDVRPYKTHEAKNFKEEMLFGNRVNRFSCANHLWVAKMKKRAGRRSSD